MRVDRHVNLKLTALITLLGTAGGVFPNVVRAQSSASQSALVLDGATVVDVEHGTLVPDQRVVVVGNHIKSVGARAQVSIPQNANVVDATGKYLIPGLWDLHTHPRTLTQIFYPLFIANGVTGIRDAWSDWPIDSLIHWRDQILAGTLVGPPRQLLTGGQPLPEDYAAMADVKARGANFLKLYPFSYEKAAAARRVGLPFGGHVEEQFTAIEASDSGMNILDHVMSSGNLNLLCLGSREKSPASVEQCRPVADRFKKNNTWWVPTLIRRISFGNKDHPTNPGPAADTVRNRLFGLAERLWADTIPHGNWLSGAVQITAPDTARFLSIAQRADLPILAGTDAGAPVMEQEVPGFALHAELSIYVAEGLTILKALQAATINPAKLMHATDSLGTVATGKLADLVLLDADPLKDITNVTTIRAVIANGRYFDRAALDKLLSEVPALKKQLPPP